MHRPVTFLLLPLSLSIFAACSVTDSGLDPLSKTLKSMEYAVAVPAPKRLEIGNVYRQRNLRQPVVRLSDALSRDQVDTLMATLGTAVSVPSFGQDTSYDLDVNADVIGKITSSLKLNGARRFNVTFEDVREYTLTELDWIEKVHPALMERLGNDVDRLLGGHAIVSLLEVGALEYTFLKESGGRLELVPGTDLFKEVTGKLGAGWKATSDGSLRIADKRFIGFRMGEITQGASVPSIGPMTLGTTNVRALSRAGSEAFMR